MNEYTKISLAGVSFNLENDAYAMLERRERDNFGYRRTYCRAIHRA